MTIVEAVRTALNHPPIGEWYRVEHHVSPEDFTAQNVREFGLDGLGELAGSIIWDGIDAGVITTQEIE